MRDPRSVARARPGDFCRMIRVPISVWAIRVMSWGQSGILPLSEMTLPEKVRWFLAKVSGPREGSGTIRAPDSGDDVSLRGGPSPHAESPIKVGAVPPLFSFFFRSLALASPSLTSPQPTSCCLDSASLALASPSSLCTTRLLLPGLRLSLSLWPRPHRHHHDPPPAVWTPPLLYSSPSFTNTVSTHATEARDDAPAVGGPHHGKPPWLFFVERKPP